MYLIKNSENKSLVLVRSEITLEAELQRYEARGEKVYVEYTDRVQLIDPMEQ